MKGRAGPNFSKLMEKGGLCQAGGRIDAGHKAFERPKRRGHLSIIEYQKFGQPEKTKKEKKAFAGGGKENGL